MNQDVKKGNKIEANKTETLVLSIYAGSGLLLGSVVLASIVGVMLTLSSLASSDQAHHQPTIVTQQFDTKPEPPAVVDMMWAVMVVSATA